MAEGNGLRVGVVIPEDNNGDNYNNINAGKVDYGHPNARERQPLIADSIRISRDDEVEDQDGSSGRPAAGIPPATFFILGMELCERLCYYGATLVFQLYSLNMLGLQNSAAIAIISAFQLWAYISPLIGGYVADVLWGKYKTILGFGSVYLVGMVCLTLSAVPFVWSDFPNTIGGLGVALFAISLFLIGLGTGGIKSNVGTLIADQLDNSREEDIEKVYRWFYWCINMGSIIGMAATPSLHQLTKKNFDGKEVGTSFWVSFLVPSCFFVLALAIFVFAKNLYVVRAPQGSLLSDVWSVLKSAWKRRNNPSLAGLPFVFKSDLSRFKKEFVIEVAQALNVCKVFVFFPVYWLLYNQMSGNFVTQGMWMNRPSWLTADQLNLVDSIIIVIFIPIMDWALPKLRRTFGWKLGALQRITIGFFIAGAGFIYVGLLQWAINKQGTFVDVDGDTTYQLNDGSSGVSVWWQVPPYLFIGISEIFSSISSLEFAYSKAPMSMKALVMAINLATNAVASGLQLIMSPVFIPQNFMAVFFAFSGGMLLLAVIFEKIFKDEYFNNIDIPERLQSEA